MMLREEYLGKMTEKFGLWRVRFDALVSKVNMSRPEIKKLIEEQREAAAQARAKLDELKASSEERYAAVKLELRKAWRGVVAALKHAERAERAGQASPAGSATRTRRD